MMSVVVQIHDGRAPVKQPFHNRLFAIGYAEEQAETLAEEQPLGSWSVYIEENGHISDVIGREVPCV